ncbi:phosphomannomutase [Phyllobacterium sp. 628]|uniref:phosphomannomutase n=1 Tax=Phyllobacterium sp. 628 TaxID=2718938 RepID=UPI0016625608|nr:phosphomannomutase [Phyllobacterium sp. 628]QND52044.1 phosphomannomutase [Phyllobacterium sp. 628]
MTSLKFGTSGLRGLVTELTDSICFAYVTAFLKHMKGHHGTPENSLVLIGYDLRASSPRITAAAIAAVQASGMQAENCGPLPTPALALRALSSKVPAIMITGSHIPDDRNGLKFYRPDGEIDKADEAGIIAQLDLAGAQLPKNMPDLPIAPDASQEYINRCTHLLDTFALKGKRIGIYQHSSVARDVLDNVLTATGATTLPLGRSDIFIPVDTEALRPEDVVLAEQAAREFSFDALVSTDGDADRPLIADENGTYMRGDNVGLLTAHFLGADAVVTPVTSNTAIELSGFFKKVYRTRVGSPFVIAGMQQAISDGYTRVIGFEANGGVLLGSTIDMDGRTIAALPTRDAMLPILSILGMAAKNGTKVSELLNGLPSRFTRSGRLEHISSDLSGPFLQSLLSAEKCQSFFAPIGTVEESDSIDGTRVVLAGGDVIHYRASGNAPELRCYAEASSDVRAMELLDWGLNQAQEAMQKQT